MPGLKQTKQNRTKWHNIGCTLNILESITSSTFFASWRETKASQRSSDCPSSAMQYSTNVFRNPTVALLLAALKVNQYSSYLSGMLLQGAHWVKAFTAQFEKKPEQNSGQRIYCNRADVAVWITHLCTWNIFDHIVHYKRFQGVLFFLWRNEKRGRREINNDESWTVK